MIKDIIKNLKPSSTLLINEKSNQLESEGKKIFKFGFGQSPFKVPQEIVDQLKSNAHQNQYLPMQGLSKLRDTVAKYTSIKKNLKPSSTLLINEKSNKLEREGKKIFKFGFGQSPFKVPQDIVNELKGNAHQNKYLPIQGLQDLRVSIANYISKKKDHKYSNSNIIVGPGSKELMFLLQILFEGEIILPAPSWVSYAPQAIIGRNKIKWIQTKSENNWFPTAKES